MNGCQIFGWFEFLKTESKPIVSFSHTPNFYHCALLYNVPAPVFCVAKLGFAKLI